MKRIATLIATTSRNTGWVRANDSSVVSTVLNFDNKSKSRCKYYIGYDSDDEFYINNSEAISELFNVVNIDFEFVQVENKTKGPCYVWNEMFNKAYDDGFDYFFQTGDDYLILNENWDLDMSKVMFEEFQDKGLTGPNEAIPTTILTQCFVSRYQMEVFGYLFPPELPSWFSDTWLTSVYSESNRMKKSNSTGYNSRMVGVSANENRYEINDSLSSKYREEYHRLKEEHRGWVLSKL